MIPVELLNAWGAAWFGLMARALIDTSALLAVDAGRVAALATAGVGPSRARPVLPGPAQADRPGSAGVVLVAAAGVGSAGGRAGLGMGATGRTEPRRQWPRRRRLQPVVLPTTGDVGASLADVSTPQPIVIAEPQRLVRRHRRSGRRLGPRRRSPAARASLSFQAWLDARLGLLRRPPAGAAHPGRREHAPADPRGADRSVRSCCRSTSRRCGARSGCACPFAGRSTSSLHSPAVGGLVWPTVVIPPDLDESLTPKQLTWVLLHELAHIRRGDLWVVVVQRVVQAVFFFNPAVHLANWIIDELREYACDDAALAACKTSRRDCGEGFLAIVERSVERAPVAAPALGLFESRMQIRRRLLRILDNHRTVHAGLSRPAAFSLLVLALFVLLVRPAGGRARPGRTTGLRSPRDRDRDARARPASGPDEPASYRPARSGTGETQGRDRANDARRSHRRAGSWCWHWPTRRTARPWPRPGTTRWSSCGIVASGRVVGRLEGHRDAVSCLAFSPDGKTLATGSYDRTVKLWDVASRRRRSHAHGAHQLDLRRGLRARRRIARLGAGTTRWCGSGTRPPAGRRPRLAGHSASVRAVAFAPDAQREPAGHRRGGSPRLDLGPAHPLGPRPPRRAQGDGPRPRVRARRSHAGDRRRGRRGEAVGHGLGPRARDVVRALGHGDVPGVLAPRRDPRHRQPRHHRQALGDEHRPGAGLAAGTPRRRLRPGVRARRPDRWRRAASTARCVSGSPPPRSSPRPPASRIPARPAAWPSRPTADRSAQPATAGIARWDVRTGSTLTAAGQRRGDGTRGGPRRHAATPPGRRTAKVRLIDADSDQRARHLPRARRRRAVDRLFARFPAPRLGRPGRDRPPLGRDRPAVPWARSRPRAVPITCVQFSPDGRTLAVATGDERRVVARAR